MAVEMGQPQGPQRPVVLVPELEVALPHLLAMPVIAKPILRQQGVAEQELELYQVQDGGINTTPLLQITLPPLVPLIIPLE
jgi:hypothetical protein